MTLGIKLFAAALAVALAVPVALAFVPRLEPAATLNTILMGRAEMKGGTTKIGEIDPAAIPTAGPDATGTFCSVLPEGKLLEGLDVSIENGCAGTISVDGGTAVPFSAGCTAHVSITMSGGVCKDYTIDDLSGDGSGENLILRVTASDVKTTAGVAVEPSILPAYRFDRLSDLARNGVEAHHGAALALVHNDDGSERMTSITGTVSFPGSASAILTEVHLFEADDDPLGRATITISGDDFAITNFGSVAAGSYVQVLLVFDADLGGEPVRTQLRGTFAP